MGRLELVDDGGGILSLKNERFEEVEFDDLTLAPSTGISISLVGVEFLDCSVSPGTCVVTSGVSLEHVTFRNLDCGDALHIASEAKLRQVSVIGSCPAALIMKPESKETFRMDPSCSGEDCLDLSRFDGKVSLVGIWGQSVRKDPSRHVTVKSAWKEKVDWKSLGIGPLSFWRILLKKLSVSNAVEGVFNLPEQNEKSFEATMEQKRALELLGLDFS